MTELQKIIYESVWYKPVAASELPGFQDSTICLYSKILNDLYNQGFLNRACAGNQRYGRYVYARPAPGKKGGQWFPNPKDLELASSKPTV